MVAWTHGREAWPGERHGWVGGYSVGSVCKRAIIGSISKTMMLEACLGSMARPGLSGVDVAVEGPIEACRTVKADGSQASWPLTVVLDCRFDRQGPPTPRPVKLHFPRPTATRDVPVLSILLLLVACNPLQATSPPSHEGAAIRCPPPNAVHSLPTIPSSLHPPASHRPSPPRISCQLLHYSVRSSLSHHLQSIRKWYISNTSFFCCLGRRCFANDVRLQASRLLQLEASSTVRKASNKTPKTVAQHVKSKDRHRYQR